MRGHCFTSTVPNVTSVLPWHFRNAKAMSARVWFSSSWVGEAPTAHSPVVLTAPCPAVLPSPATTASHCCHPAPRPWQWAAAVVPSTLAALVAPVLTPSPRMPLGSLSNSHVRNMTTGSGIGTRSNGLPLDVCVEQMLRGGHVVDDARGQHCR
jgi:hypothetical protein